MDITRHIVGTRPSGRAYYGNAEPEGPTVVCGGAEIVVGGWVSYEATRREAHWAANPLNRAAQPRSRYDGRTCISGQDAVESLVAARSFAGGAGDPLARAAERAAEAVAAFDQAVGRGPATVWTRLGLPPDAPKAVSTITPDDIRDMAQETDTDLLLRAAEDVGILASSYARGDELSRLRAPRPPGRLPPVPTREIPLRGENVSEVNRAVVDLEKASVSRGAAVEIFRGKVAALFDSAAEVLERAVETPIPN